jgi:hypothetical protein
MSPEQLSTSQRSLKNRQAVPLRSSAVRLAICGSTRANASVPVSPRSLPSSRAVIKHPHIDITSLEPRSARGKPYRGQTASSGSSSAAALEQAKQRPQIRFGYLRSAQPWSTPHENSRPPTRTRPTPAGSHWLARCSTEAKPKKRSCRSSSTHREAVPLRSSVVRLIKCGSAPASEAAPASPRSLPASHAPINRPRKTSRPRDTPVPPHRPAGTPT